MNPVKLACLINDTWDAVERSKVGAIYLKKSDGTLVTTADGCPYVNTAASQIFQCALQAQIMSKGLHNED